VTKLEYLLIAALMSIAVMAGMLPLQQRLALSVDRLTAALQPLIVEGCNPPFCIMPGAGPEQP
jgi:Flp pilus assembly pilin Flp